MVKKAFFVIGKALAFMLLSVIIVSLIGTASFVAYAKSSKNTDVTELEELARAQDRTTKLYYVASDGIDGSLVVRELEGQALFARQNREWVRYADMPSELIDAFVSIEDHRYFTHSGIDLKRTAGAIKGFISGSGSYGGSTITQQLIKNVTGQDSYSVSRKIRELIKARRLDKALSKEEILELYLNTIYLAEGCYGVGAASQRYFAKDPNELSLVECAALAAIPQAPTKWDPITHPENNRERRSVVLRRMNELGVIDDQTLSKALNEELNTSNDRTRNTDSEQIHSWYTESVIDESIELLVKNGIASSIQTAKKLLYTGGLKIVTAQNPKMQKAVEEYFENEGNFYKRRSLIHPECSMVVIDPQNGRILALAGATGKKEANRTLNYATATHRSPGSSIKPLSVYAPAIDLGCITYASVIDDTPCRFVSDGRGGMRGWPQNYPNGYRGLTTVRDAVARSVNTVAVKTLSMVGKERAFSILTDQLEIDGIIASQNGMYTDIADSPLALGQLTKGVTVRDISSAYTALANGGVFNKGKTVLKILDSEGRVLIDNVSEGKRVFSEQTACITTKLLAGVTSSGTASAMTLTRQVECAGKTGTTTADCDRWFVGYTPDLVAGVWFGYPTPRSLDGYPHSPGPAVATFDNVMKILNTEEYLGHAPREHFENAEGILTAKYCRDSGKLVSSACLCDPRGCRVETGYFTKETVPTEYCDVHTLVLYDTVNGGVASADCPPENCRYVGLLNVKRSFPYEVYIADAQYTCRKLYGSNPCLDSSKPYFYDGTMCGKSHGGIPFNRFCSGCYLEARAFEDQEETAEEKME